MQIKLQALVETSGMPHPLSLRALRIGSGVLQELPALLKQLGEFPQMAIVCDDHTYAAAGRRVEALVGDVQTICLRAEDLHADERAVDEVRAQLQQPCSLLLAVGSGTIHDITRYTAHERGIPFLSLPTAPSVDGFTSNVAAMTWKGCKQTFPAVSPLAILADSDVFAACPPRLIAAGVGDLYGKYIAMFDWKVAHLVTGEAIYPTVLRMEEEALATINRQIDAIAARKKSALEQLMYALILSGLAIQGVGNSRPASGCEHHMAHFWEMHVLNAPLDALHGEKVGMGTILACDYYHRLGTLPEIESHYRGYAGLPVDQLRSLFGDRAAEILRENTPDPLTEVDKETFCRNFSSIRTWIEALPHAEDIAADLRRCHGVTTLEEIGLSNACIPATLEWAPFVRNRLTLLRLSRLLDCGV